MKVTFTKTHARGYSVLFKGAGMAPSLMNPAPGYDDRLPHDVAHLIVENELGITGGIFRQLAARGAFAAADAKHRRRSKRQSDRLAKTNRADMLFSEHAVYAAQSRWEKHDIIPDTKIPLDVIDRICRQFDEFSERWSKLPIGGSIALEWGPPKSGHSKFRP